MRNIDEADAKETGAGSLAQPHLTFWTGGRYYGIPAGHVVEIIKLRPSIRLPESPVYSAGIIHLRGRAIPLIDVNLLFGNPEMEYTDRACIVIVDVDGRHTGLIVDAVDEVLTISESQTRNPPVYSGGHQSGYVTRIAALDKNTALLLDVCLLVSDGGGYTAGL